MVKNYLFVVAHPDDEVLGAGATMYELAKQGHNVHVCILSDNCDTRYDDIVKNMRKSHEILGVQCCFLGHFKCLELKSAPHHEMVKFIEDAIINCQADVIITHHPNDVNIDHYYASEVCREAARLSQRQTKLAEKAHKLQDLMFMEVNSSTDWSLDTTLGFFVPNTYMPVSKEAIEKKIEALEVYEDIVRPAPHPRSKEVLTSCAVVRGSQCGYLMAEAFQSMFKVGV